MQDGERRHFGIHSRRLSRRLQLGERTNERYVEVNALHLILSPFTWKRREKGRGGTQRSAPPLVTLPPSPRMNLRTFGCCYIRTMLRRGGGGVGGGICL